LRLPPSPEIENADLTGLALDLVRWGAKTPVDLSWLNPPRETPWRLARDRLVSSNALRLDGEITALGKRLSDFPLPPRLALMVLRGAEIGQAQLAADIAALLSERDLGGRYTEGEALSSDAVETREEARYDHDARRVRARRAKMLGAIGLVDGPLPAPSGDLVRRSLLDAIREQSLGLLRHGDGAQTIIGRIELLSRAIGNPWPAAFGQRAMSRLEEWLGPQLGSPGALDSLSSGQIADALRSFELSKFPCRDSCRADYASAAFAVSFKSNFSKSLRDRRDLC